MPVKKTYQKHQKTLFSATSTLRNSQQYKCFVLTLLSKPVCHSVVLLVRDQRLITLFVKEDATWLTVSKTVLADNLGNLKKLLFHLPNSIEFNKSPTYTYLVTLNFTLHSFSIVTFLWGRDKKCYCLLSLICFSPHKISWGNRHHEALKSKHLSHMSIVFIQTPLSRCINCLRSSSGLVMLLQDPDPVVRVKAAEAMGHFHWHSESKVFALVALHTSNSVPAADKSQSNCLNSNVLLWRMSYYNVVH